MTATEPWTCPTCAASVVTPFCATCGERQLSPRDLTLRGLLEQLFHAASNIDGRLVQSLRFLLTRPGALSVAYLRGQRMPFLTPFQLFLLANVTFFGVQSITHTNIVSSTLDSHLHHQDWSGVARSLVSNRLAARRLTVGELAPIFDRRAVLIAKSLIILMTFPFTAVAALLFHRARKPFAAHAVFSLHLYAFLLLLFCGSLAVSGLDVWLGGAGLSSARWDNALSGVNLAVCALYLRAAIGVVYGTAGPLRLVQATVLAASVAGILLGYRFLVFVLTLYAV